MRGRWGWIVCLVLGACALDSNDRRVHGRVVDVAGNPLSDVRVSVLGEMLTTDLNGRFVASAPTTDPYDVMLQDHSGNYFYAGMSERSPTFRLRQRFEGSANSGDFTIVVPRDDTDTLRSTQFFTVEGANDVEYWFNFDGSLRNRHYSMRWRSTASSRPATLRAYALQYEADPETGAPTRYVGFSEFTAAVTDNASVLWIVEWQPYPWDVGTLNVRANLPPEHVVGDTRVEVRINDTAPPFWFLTANGLASMLVPDGEGFTYNVKVLAFGIDAASTRTIRNVEPSDAELVLNVEPGPSLLSPPPDSPSLGVGTTLRWTNPANLPVFIYLLPPTFDAPGLTLMCHCSELQIPDIGVFGQRFPSQTEYTWAVFATTFDSVDDLASIATENHALAESTYGYSGYRTIRTAAP